MEIDNIMLLHGKGGSPLGSVQKFEESLRHCSSSRRELVFQRPQLLHSDPTVLAERSLAAFSELNVPVHTALIGISLGGLIAAKYQEQHHRDDIHVIAISSPVWADGVHLSTRMAQRIALYSSADAVIRGRTEAWPRFASAFDLPWLTHDTDLHLQELARIVSAYMNEGSVPQAIVDLESCRSFS